MTFKDFKIIADAVAHARDDSAPCTAEYPTLSRAYDEGYEDAHALAINAVIGRMAESLAASNPRFDRDLFVAACK